MKYHINFVQVLITLKPAQESFRQGWQEVLVGETLPIETLWEGIDEDAKKETR